MPRKAPRPDHQVQLLAADLGRRWVAADGIEPWLRRNLARLTRLVRDDGWSWADVGRAMTTAGILYGTGKPWSGPLLQAKVGQVRTQLRRRERDRTARDSAPPPPVVAPAVMPAAAPRPALAAEPPGGEPEFQFVRFRSSPPTSPRPAPFDPGEYVEPPRRTFPLGRLRGLGPPQASPVPAPTPQQQPAPAVDVDAVLARFRGEPYPKD